MANSSHLPSGNVRELRPGLTQPRTSGKLRAVTPEPPVSHEEPAPEAISEFGPRKLVRPKLPERMAREQRFFSSRSESPILAHQAPMITSHGDASSHAEAFYFQKQVQTQTLMVFVLEDGEQVEGYIEWYDRDAIKLRNGRRVLIYKSAIKYLYKAGETHTSLDGLATAR